MYKEYYVQIIGKMGEVIEDFSYRSDENLLKINRKLKKKYFRPSHYVGHDVKEIRLFKEIERIT